MSNLTNTTAKVTLNGQTTRLRLLTVKGWITKMVVPGDMHIPLSRATEIEILSQLSPGETSFLNLHGNAISAGSETSEDIRVDVSQEGKLSVTRISPLRKSFSHGALITGGMTDAYSQAMKHVADTDDVIRSLQEQLAASQQELKQLKGEGENHLQKTLIAQDGDPSLPATAQNAGNILPDISQESKTGRYWIDEIVTSLEGNLFYLYTPNADLNHKNDETHLQLKGGTTWYNHTLGAIILEPSDIPNCLSVRKGSIVNYQGVYYWYVSVTLTNDESGKKVALLRSDNLTQKPLFIDFVLSSNGRDPHVTISSGEKPFLMVISCLNGVEFYRSLDGKSWSLENSFPLPNFGVIECPQYLPSLNGQQALLFCSNDTRQPERTGSYLSWGSYSSAAGWQEVARQRLDAGADCYGGYLNMEENLFYSWVGNWAYSPDLLLGKKFGQITTQQISYIGHNKLALRPLTPEDTYPAHMVKKKVIFEGERSECGFSALPDYCHIELFLEGSLQEGDYIALTAGGMNAFSLTKISSGYEFSRSQTSTAPFYDEEIFNKTQVIPLQEGDYTSLILRLTPYSVNIYCDTGSDANSAQYFITRPHDALFLETHFLQSFQGSAALHYIPQDVRIPMGLKKEDIGEFVKGTSLTATDETVTHIYYRPQDESEGLDYITCEYRDKNGNLGYISLKSFEWVENNFQTKQEAQQAASSYAAQSSVTNLQNEVTNLQNSSPHVAGISGTPLIQAFIASGSPPGQNPVTIMFPNAFKEGTTPVVTCLVNQEPASHHYSRTMCFEMQPDVTNIGFTVQLVGLCVNWINTSGEPYIMHIIAIGEAP